MSKILNAGTGRLRDILERAPRWSVCEPHRSAVQWADATNCRVGHYEQDTERCRMVERILVDPALTEG